MYYGYVKNELVKRSRRSMFVVLGIALSIGVFVAVNSLADAFMNAAQKPLQDFGTDIIVQRSGDTPEDFEGATVPCSQVIITADEVEAVKQLSGVKSMSTALLMWVFEGTNYSDSGSFYIVTGMEPGEKTGPGIANEWLIEGEGISPGDTGVVLVESAYASQKDIQIGDDITVADQVFSVRGIVRMPVNSLISVSNIYMTLEDAQGIASRAKNMPDYKPGDVNEIFLQADPSRISTVIEEIKEVVPATSVTSSESLIQAIGGIVAQSQSLAVLASIVVLLVALMVVAKSISGNVMERRGEIGIMKTVGWTSKDVYRQLMAETFVQSIVGGIAGITFGLVAALVLGRLKIAIPVAWDIDPYPHFLMTDTSQKALDVGLPVQVSPSLVALALILSVAVGLISAFLTLNGINRIKPLEVLRYE